VSSRKPAIRRLMIGAVVAAVLAIPASSAQAVTQHHYWGGVLQPFVWGGLGLFDSRQMVGSIASYPGSGNVTVCEAVFSIDIGQFVHSSCGTNAAGQVNNVQQFFGSRLSPQVQNGSMSAHTIDGFAYSNP
jgi:hypothetical protein